MTYAQVKKLRKTRSRSASRVVRSGEARMVDEIYPADLKQEKAKLGLKFLEKEVPILIKKAKEHELGLVILERDDFAELWTELEKKLRLLFDAITPRDLAFFGVEVRWEIRRALGLPVPNVEVSK